MNAFRVFITPAGERSLKKLPPRVRKTFLTEVARTLSRDPYLGYQLSEPFDGLRSFHFSAAGEPYRAAYSVDSGQRTVTIHYAGYRGGFYERLRRLFA